MSPPIHPLASSQGAVFLVNSRQRNFSCGLHCWRQTLFRSYGRFFAEFLEDLSLVRLSLLDLNTCVGFRYGRHMLKLRSFSWNRALYALSLRRETLFFRLEYCLADLPTKPPHGTNPNPIMGHRYSNPSLLRTYDRSGNINPVSIRCGFRHPLRPD